MRYRFVMLVWLVAAALGGCGKEIGDACIIATDCSPNGDRVCDPVSNSPGGYCTIQGCDVTTCPGEAACIRFFSGSFSNKECNFADPKDACSRDELCAVNGHCVARSSETRFCMRTCGDDSDCRDGYECRDLDRMRRHGGEPWLGPGVVVDETAPKFCAVAGP